MPDPNDPKENPAKPTGDGDTDEIRPTEAETPLDEPTAGEPQATVLLTPEEIARLDEESYPSDPDDPLVGTLLRNKWRVLRRIGAGSFGTVYKVRDENGGWIEALKILSVDRLRGPDGENMRERFLREARIMKRLGSLSPHIVGLSTYEDDIEAGLIYFLMEHVEGRVLSEVLMQEGPLGVDRTIRIGLQVCDALIAAHEGDDPVVHRDLKLENVMLTTDRDGEESVKVLDFGIAKIVEHDADSQLTGAGSLGTPGYAAPEQLRAEEVDGRTDLFAFGVILYSLVTGRNPWLGHLAHLPSNQTYELMAASDRAEVLPFSESGVDVPQGMVDIILKLLQRDPGDRFQSARELYDELYALGGGEISGGLRGPTQELKSRKDSGHSSTPERRLAAVWFADLVGYSSLSSQDEEAALALLDVFHKTARRVIEGGGGRVVQFIGDAVFAEFSSTQRAVRTAKDFVDSFTEDTANSRFTSLLRVGIHVGDVLMAADGDLFGDGVNVAARIQNEAEPGQILVSQDVWGQLRQRRDFGFVAIGERKLKGVPPINLFAVVEAGDVVTTGDLAGERADPITTGLPAYPGATREAAAGRSRAKVAAAAIVAMLAVGGGGYAALNMLGDTSEPAGVTSTPEENPGNSDVLSPDPEVVETVEGRPPPAEEPDADANLPDRAGDPPGEETETGGANAATDPPPPDDVPNPLLAPYERELERVGATRNQALGVVRLELRDRLDDAEDLWISARGEAEAERYRSALDDLLVADGIYTEVIADSELMGQIDGARRELDRLRGAARDPDLIRQAEGFERAAQQAVAAGRFPDAIVALGRASTRMSDAAREPDPPPPPDMVPDEVVADVLRRLKAAMEAEDLSRIRTVWTSITAEEVQALEAFFRAVSDLTVTYNVQSVSGRGPRLISTVQVIYNFADSDDPVIGPTQVFDLEQSGADWLIVASRLEG